MENDTAEDKRARLIRRLGVVCDDGRTYRIRLSAVKAIQGMLREDHPLRLTSANELLDQVKRPWDTKPVLVSGRQSLKVVSRPPEGLGDLW
jgi:hypothetical protein